MSRYIDLVLVKHQKDATNLFLFRAPAFSYLKEGAHVICKCSDKETFQEMEGWVVSTLTVNPDSEYYKFILTAVGLKADTKVEDLDLIEYKVQYSLLEYPEDDEEE